jgi:putative exporter of polyketide antibiotics
VSSLYGTRRVIRLILRRDRIILPLWVLFFSLFPVSLASSIANLYPTQADREKYFAEGASNPSYKALFGPAFSSDLGALVAQRMTDVMVIISLLNLLTVIRHTRNEEEAGRRELLASTPLGRQAPLAAALVVTFAANLVLGIIYALGLMSLDLSGPGVIELALSLTLIGCTFAAVGALVAQISTSARIARSVGIGALALVYLFRLVGDAGGENSGLSWVSWLSPIHWLREIRPFTDDRWWLILPVLALIAVTAFGAYSLSARRDLGAGLLAERLGPAEGSPVLRSPLALAWRMHRGALIGWSIGFAVAGAFFGGIAKDAGANVGDNQNLRDIVVRMGGSAQLSDGFLASLTGVVGLIAGAYAIQTVLRLRNEEAEQRAEPILATSVTRLRWAASHLAFTLLGPAVALVSYGLVAGLVYGSSTSDVGSQLPRVLGGALVQLPAVWTLAAVTVVFFGLLPRVTPIAWGALALCLLFGQFGAIFNFDQWLLDISPFTHVPRLPGGDVTAVPLVLLSVIAAAMAAAGLAGLRRRDMPIG